MRTQYVTYVGYTWWQVLILLGAVFVGLIWMNAIQDEWRAWLDRRAERREDKHKSLLLEGTLRTMIDKIVEPEPPKRPWWQRMWDWTRGIPGPIDEASDDRPEAQVWDSTKETGEQFVDRTNPMGSRYEPDEEAIDAYMAMEPPDHDSADYPDPEPEDQPGRFLPKLPEDQSRWWVRGNTLHLATCHLVRTARTDPHPRKVFPVDPQFSEDTVRAWVDRQKLNLCGRCKPLTESIEVSREPGNPD